MIIAPGEKIFGTLLAIAGAGIILTGHWATTDDMIADLIAGLLLGRVRPACRAGWWRLALPSRLEDCLQPSGTTRRAASFPPHTGVIAWRRTNRGTRDWRIHGPEEGRKVQVGSPGKERRIGMPA